jgi:hypothetical protein
MEEVELKVKINDVELEFEGGFADMMKFYAVIKKDFLDKDQKESKEKEQEKSDKAK